jgi:hypothetical protein
MICASARKSLGSMVPAQNKTWHGSLAERGNVVAFGPWDAIMLNMTDNKWEGYTTWFTHTHTHTLLLIREGEGICKVTYWTQ